MEVDLDAIWAATPKVLCSAIRIAFGWTRQEIADYCEVDSRAVDFWLAGRGAHPRHLHRLRKAVFAAQDEVEKARFMQIIKEYSL